jgi:uncharacterized membrane protein YdbT with pleckstrin-like domain
MSYVDRVLQPGERVVMRTTLHWVIYLPGLVALIAAVVAYFGAAHFQGALTIVLLAVALVLAVVGLLAILRAWFHRWGTEIAATDRRVIYKSGVVSRRTVEMNMEQIESVEVDQTILGRLLDYGDVTVHGVGEGTERFSMIASPLAIRSAITAR